MYTLDTFIQHCTGNFRKILQEEELKFIKIGKGEVKLPLCRGHDHVYRTS